MLDHHRAKLRKVLILPFFSVALCSATTVYSGSVSRTYTLDADFGEGTLINVNHDTSDQLQLHDVGEAFNFIWVAASARWQHCKN